MCLTIGYLSILLLTFKTLFLSVTKLKNRHLMFELFWTSGKSLLYVSFTKTFNGDFRLVYYLAKFTVLDKRLKLHGSK